MKINNKFVLRTLINISLKMNESIMTINKTFVTKKITKFVQS